MALFRILVILLLFPSFLFAQTVVWQEDFSNGCSVGCLGNTYNGVNGFWTETSTGTQGSTANLWYISCAENNTGVNNCSGNCGTTQNETLHIGIMNGNPSCTTGDCGASFEGGVCPPLCSATDMRIESPTINLTGNNGITLNFTYIEGGDGLNDNATLWYYDGTTWMELADPASTNNGSCSSGDGQWTAYSIGLPSSANNNPNVKIGFRWKNNSDGVAAPVSFAVDDLSLSLIPPTASFTASSTTICQNNCITFNNSSTFQPGATFAWSFGNGQNSTSQDPGSICYPTAGTYTVSLTVTDANGTDTQTSTNYITVNAGPNAGTNNSTTLCNNTTINLNALLVGANPGGTWSETTASPSGNFNATTAVFDANCLSPGNYTFIYVLSSGTCTDTASFTVTVAACGGPSAGIIASSLTGCIGQSIIFADNSCGSNVNSWLWSFGGGIPGTANTQGPHSILFNNPGVYNIFLQISDDNGTDSQTIQVTISGCGAPVAAFNPATDTICNQDCLTFDNNTTTSGTTTYAWSFPGATPDTSNLSNPGEICYDTLITSPITLPIELTVTNSFGTSNFTQYITIMPPPTITTCCGAIVEMGSPVGLSANESEGTVSWTWYPDNQGNIVECITANCDSVNVTPLITTDFIATTTTENGCVALSIVKVLVDFETVIGVPNSFSPNDNGFNDRLRVRGSGISEMIFRIYNRYGQLIYESTEIDDPGWDGTANGKEEKSGTFLYTLEYTLIDGTSGTKSGNVTLIR